MPFVSPLPLGGLSTELGSLSERLRALEAARSGSITADAPGPTTLASGQSFPTGWPDLDVSVATTHGVMVIGGSNVSNQTLISGSPQLLLLVDGNSTPLIVATVVVFADGAPITIFTYVPGLSLGTHEFQLQAVGVSGTAAIMTNTSLTVVPV